MKVVLCEYFFIENKAFLAQFNNNSLQESNWSYPILFPLKMTYSTETHTEKSVMPFYWYWSKKELGWGTVWAFNAHQMMIWSGKIIPFSSRSFSKFSSCSTPCWAPIDFKERSMGVQSKMRIWPRMHNFCALLFITYTISTGFEKALTEAGNGSWTITYLLGILNDIFNCASGNTEHSEDKTMPSLYHSPRLSLLL